MHLPPLDVAVYPVVTMSRGTYAVRASRPSSTISSSSSSSSTSSRTCTTTPDFSSIQRIIRSVFRSSKITVHQAEYLPGSLHQVFLTRLGDGSCLVLKCPPSHNVRLLRHEKHLLETERKTLETLREYTQIPVPQLIKHDSTGGALGIPFLMISHVPGRRLSELSPYLAPTEKQTIDRTLGSYVRALTSLSATQFGMTHRVFAKKGSNSWREAFLALLEAGLRDAEDMLVTVPYDSIRYYIGKHAHFLEDVTEPRLVALNVCDPSNVLIDEESKRITGLVGFSNVIWGDPLMTGGIADGSEAFFEGLGECPMKTGGIRARLLMYTAYRAITNIVTHHYRTHLGIDELEARRQLSCALNELAAM
ncbi:hypothetical protein J1614_001981 [Plenodomus biglobosus]|nr:hypothetical protein J1614_001981 [Plenodomus biglobosus]